MGAGHDNLAHQANTVVPVQLRSSLRALDHVVNDHASAAQRVAANGCSTAAVVKPEALLLHTSEVFPPRAKDEGIVSAVANNTTSLFKKASGNAFCRIQPAHAMGNLPGPSSEAA